MEGAMGVTTALKLTVRSSMASPLSKPVSSTSRQRTKSSCPGETVTPVNHTWLKVCRLVEALPSNGAAAPDKFGETKLSALKTVHVPEMELEIGTLLT